MKRFALALGLALLSTTALAGTPPEVIELYKAYAAAMKSGDYEKASIAAEKAYNQAVKLMPDDPQTAALAINYADVLDPTEVDKRLDLYDAALSLLPEPRDANAWQERVDVLTKVGKAHMYRREIKPTHFRKLAVDLSDLKAALQSADMTTSTFAAEALVIEAWKDYQKGDERTALQRIDEAAAIFESPEHTFFSELEYQASLLKGVVLKANDKPIESALALQKVMQNLEGELPADHHFIKTAFSQWVGARSLIESKGQVDEALAAGVCKCWPYDEMSTNAPVPEFRMPPKMPSSARRSGQVLFKFDLDETGKPINILPTAATEASFIKSATKAIENWRYDVQPNHTAEDRTGLATTITFRLTNNRGQIIPERELQPIEQQ